MLIKKLDEAVISLNKTISFTLEINGKKITAYEHIQDDSYGCDINHDIEESDITRLTDKEREAVSDYFTEILSCKVGQSYDTEKAAEVPAVTEQDCTVCEETYKHKDIRELCPKCETMGRKFYKQLQAIPKH